MYILHDTSRNRPREGYWHCECRDCTVRAFSAAVDVPYERAHYIARGAGRKYGKGFWSDKLLAYAGRLGLLTYTCTSMLDKSKMPKAADERGHWRIPRLYPTLAQVMPLLEHGRYILETRTHALAVVDGQIYDGSKLRLKQRIHDIYEIKIITNMS